MLQLEGQIINVFEAPKGTNKDGQEYGGQSKVQLLGQVWLKNGESKSELLTLTCEGSVFAPLVGKKIQVAVGAIAPSKGTIIYFIPQGTTPRIL